MQLPRGTFHSIRKGVILRVLLDEMEKGKFTGYCSISSPEVTSTLVLSSGAFILAEFNKHEGEQAWHKLQGFIDTKVDAGLTSLDAMQLQLVREFNPHSTLPGMLRRSPTRHVKTGIGSSVPVKPTETREPETLTPHRKSISPTPGAATGRVAVPDASRGKNEAPDEGTNAEATSNFDRDLEALDQMNIGEMTKKIRETCKVTVKSLDLEYLLKNLDDH